MPEPDFENLAQQLDETVSKLKVTKDPEQRKSLLQTMRRLLVEADRINADWKSPPS
jgi:predicted NAD-dependent protein-ADP-ribosyltransferase YbiA (DUF1768 family)